jgi:hypothetical protein
MVSCFDSCGHVLELLGVCSWREVCSEVSRERSSNSGAKPWRVAGQKLGVSLVSVGEDRRIAHAALRQCTLEFRTRFSSHVQDRAVISPYFNCNPCLNP